MVTVVIPTHDRAHLIGRALRSVLSQTYGNWECIVVDDASGDGTEAVVSTFEDPRIRYVAHPENRGGGAARNTGIRAARGDFVAFLDSDDEWAPPLLQRQLERFERTELEEVGMVYAGGIQRKGAGVEVRRVPDHRGWLFDALLRENVIGGTSVAMVRRQVLLECEGFDETLSSRQDLDLWLRIALRNQIDFVQDLLVTFHQPPGEPRITTDFEKRVAARTLFFAKWEVHIRKAGITHEFHYRTGRYLHVQVGRPRTARTWYLRSLRARPTFLPPYVGLLMTLVPQALQTRMIRRWRSWKD